MRAAVEARTGTTRALETSADKENLPPAISLSTASSSKAAVSEKTYRARFYAGNRRIKNANKEIAVLTERVEDLTEANATLQSALTRTTVQLRETEAALSAAHGIILDGNNQFQELWARVTLLETEYVRLQESTVSRIAEEQREAQRILSVQIEEFLRVKGDNSELRKQLQKLKKKCARIPELVKTALAQERRSRAKAGWTSLKAKGVYTAQLATLLEY